MPSDTRPDARAASARPLTLALIAVASLAALARADAPNDAYFANQWHLLNTGQNGGLAGNDINVAPWWNFAAGTHQGAGVNIGVVDDGLQWQHPDLTANYKASLSYDFNYSDADPTPDLADDMHGTSVAGVAAGVGNNGIGMTGVAPKAGLAGIRLISAAASDALEAQALTYHFNGASAADTVHIYSNSWGPSDDGATLEAPGAAVKAAFANATTNGRGGKGSIYVWAAGNGGENEADNSNFDGYANSRYVIAVAASTNTGTRSYYSERGSNVFVNAPSSGTAASSGIYTTDRTGTAGYNTTGTADGDPFADTNYTSTFGGTSSAAPVVSGVVALMLEANPNLGWRDVKHILARTSTKIDPANGSWKTNAAGFSHSEIYGFGRVNAAAAATMAATWTNVGPELKATANSTRTTALAIPDGTGTTGAAPGASVSDSILVTAQLVLETIEVTVNATHTYRGDLGITLTSPSGVVSALATPRDDSGDNYSWTFTTVRDWGELAAGLWTLSLRDYYGSDTGRLNSWSMAMYGTAVPEPTALVIAAAGFGLFVRRRRTITSRD